MLIAVKAQDWKAEFTYAPPLVDVLINPDDILMVSPTESRGAGPFCKLKLRSGDELIVHGAPLDVLKSCQTTTSADRLISETLSQGAAVNQL